MKWIWLMLFAVPVIGQNCVPASALAPNDTQSGELTNQSCRLADATMVSAYRFVLPSRGTLRLSATSSAFSPYLIVRDLDGRMVESGNSIQRFMEAGAYSVLLNGAGTGRFQIASVFQPEANVLCTVSNRIGLGRNVAGQLASTSCKLPDGSPFDSWQTTVFGAGTLTVTMGSATADPFLILRAEDGTLLASDNQGGGKDAQITLPVSGRETYTIVASSATNPTKPAQYQLSVDFSPDSDDTCIPLRALTDSVQISGSVSAASCNFNLPQRQDSSLFNIYSLHLSSPGTVQLSVAASTFTPLLLLIDQDGNSIVEDSESGGLYTPLIRQTLPAGDYSALIFNEDSFEGDYTLEYNFDPGLPSKCAVQDLSDGIAVSGALAGDTSCRFSELLSDTYRFSLATASTAQLSLASGDFTTFLELRDAKDNLLGFSGQTTDGSSAYFVANLPAGTYFLSAASVDLPGNYNLNAKFTPTVIPPCPGGQNLPVNTGFIGNLGQGSCTGLTGEAFDLYRFTTPADGTAALVMTSGDLDSYLTLLDNNGASIRTDDNSYAQSDALIVQYLKAGSYRVQAQSRGTPNVGKYRLDLLWTAGARPSACAAMSSKIGVVVAATLTYTACQYYDKTFADFYQFTVTDPSRPVTILAGSSAFDSYLVLTDSKGNVVATDDNSGGSESGNGTDAAIVTLLDPGVYYVAVKPAGDPTQSGSYRLSIQQ